MNVSGRNMLRNMAMKKHINCILVIAIVIYLITSTRLSAQSSRNLWNSLEHTKIQMKTSKKITKRTIYLRNLSRHQWIRTILSI